MRHENCEGGRRGGWARMMMDGGRRRGGGHEPFDGGEGRGRGFGRRGHGPFGWSEGGDGLRRRGPGGPRGRMFATGELRLLLLKLIADESRHGYELIRAVEELTGGRYAPSPGVVYPTLSLLLDEGAIEEVGEQAPRKAFAATEAGRSELAARAEEAGKVIERLRAHGEDGERRFPAPLARAVGNLVTAVRGRAGEGELDRETIHQIAEILDDAARKVERL